MFSPKRSTLPVEIGECVRPRPVKDESPGFCNESPADQGECDLSPSSAVPGGRIDATKAAEGGAVMLVEMESRVSYEDRELHVVVDVIPESRDSRVRLYGTDARVNGPLSACKSRNPDELLRGIADFSSGRLTF